VLSRSTTLLLAALLAALALAPAAVARTDAPADRVHLLLGLADDASPAPALPAGARVERRLPAVDAAVVSVPARTAPAALAALRADGGVEYAARETVRRPALVPNDPLFARRTWPFVATSVTDAWDVTTGAADVVIAVLDSGIDASHPDLPRLAPGHDFVNDDADPDDDLGHGTEVAGAIGARFGNGVGASGVCPGCTLMPVKVIDGVSGVASDADIVAGIVWATDHGADVINLSLAGPEYSRALEDGVRYATSRGVVVVAAGGNDGTATKQYPAASEGVVGVAASNDRNGLYDFSNHGVHLDVAAPGCVYTTFRRGAYGEACGTSIAAPLVAGIAGLLRSRRPGLSGDQVASLLGEGARRGLGLDVEDGLVDARQALTLADALSPADAAPAAPPSVTVAGPARIGKQLLARWRGAAPAALRFQWQVCTAVLRCSNVPGGTSAALLVSRSHLGKRLRVRTVSTRPDGTTASLVSAASAVVRR
jgi:subtilisin family serine protease